MGISSSSSLSSSELDGKSPGCGTLPVLRAMAASFLALAAARRCSRVSSGLLDAGSSSDDDSSSDDSSSDDDALGSFSTISFPSASRGRRFREKCFPPNSLLVEVPSSEDRGLTHHLE